MPEEYEMNLVDFFAKMTRPALVLLCVLLVIFLGILDYVTGEELFFLEFYLLPVLLATWFVSEKAGIILSVISSVFWFIDDVVSRSPSNQPLVPYFNIFLKLLVFVVFARIVSTLKTAIERERIAERELLQREMDIAREVQEGLFPQTFPAVKTLDYIAVCKPAKTVGGDYYDFLELGEGKIAIAIGDVAGKGISSALLMSNLQAMLRSRLFYKQYDIDLSINEINQLLCLSTGRKKYATFFCAVYDDSLRMLTFVNAGHNPPFWVRPSGQSAKIRRLTATGTVLGLFPDITFCKTTVKLRPGDTIFCFTDGVTEATNAQDEEFGEENLSFLIAGNLKLSAIKLADLILDRVNQFVGRAVQHDDLTFVILKVL
jgi:phosphoserine phosphatase RsbU/P